MYKKKTFFRHLIRPIALSIALSSFAYAETGESTHYEPLNMASLQALSSWYSIAPQHTDSIETGETGRQALFDLDKLEVQLQYSSISPETYASVFRANNELLQAREASKKTLVSIDAQWENKLAPHKKDRDKLIEDSLLDSEEKLEKSRKWLENRIKSLSKKIEDKRRVSAAEAAQYRRNHNEFQEKATENRANSEISEYETSIRNAQKQSEETQQGLKELHNINVNTANEIYKTKTSAINDFYRKWKEQAETQIIYDIESAQEKFDKSYKKLVSKVGKQAPELLVPVRLTFEENYHPPEQIVQQALNDYQQNHLIYPLDMLREASTEESSLYETAAEIYGLMKSSVIGATAQGMMRLVSYQLLGSQSQSAIQSLIMGLSGSGSSEAAIANGLSALAGSFFPPAHFIGLVSSSPELVKNRIAETAYSMNFAEDSIEVADDTGEFSEQAYIRFNIPAESKGFLSWTVEEYPEQALEEVLHLSKFSPSIDLVLKPSVTTAASVNPFITALKELANELPENARIRIFPLTETAERPGELAYKFVVLKTSESGQVQYSPLFDLTGNWGSSTENRWLTSALAENNLINSSQHGILYKLYDFASSYRSSQPVVNPISSSALKEIKHAVSQEKLLQTEDSWSNKEIIRVSKSKTADAPRFVQLKHSGQFVSVVDMEGASIVFDSFAAQGTGSPRATLKTRPAAAFDEATLASIDEKRSNRYPQVLMGEKPFDPVRHRVEMSIAKILLTQQIFSIGEAGYNRLVKGETYKEPLNTSNKHENHLKTQKHAGKNSQSTGDVSTESSDTAGTMQENTSETLEYAGKGSQSTGDVSPQSLDTARSDQESIPDTLKVEGGKNIDQPSASVSEERLVVDNTHVPGDSNESSIGASDQVVVEQAIPLLAPDVAPHQVTSQQHQVTPPVKPVASTSSKDGMFKMITTTGPIYLPKGHTWGQNSDNNDRKK